MESIKSGFKSLFGLVNTKSSSGKTHTTAGEESTSPAKKRRKQDEHTVNLCPILSPINKVPSKPVRAANTLDGLLSDLTSEENLIDIFKTDAWDDNIYCSRILKSPYGTLADEFQKYLSSREEKETLKVEAIRKFSFLILIEIVLQCKDRTKQAPVFDHLVSLFLNNKSDNYIELKNDLISDELSSLEIREDAQHSNAIKYLRMAKNDAKVWEGGKGCLVPIYNVQFRNSPEFKTFSEKNVFVACLLSIL